MHRLGRVRTSSLTARSATGVPRCANRSRYPCRPRIMAAIHITDIEAAINWWRERSPSPDGITACAEVRALAEVYALLVYRHENEADEASMPAAARAAWLGWYAQHARRPVHRDLLHHPGRRGVQGLRPHRRRGAALARDVARRKSAPSGAASRCRPRPGASTATPSAHAPPPASITRRLCRQRAHPRSHEHAGTARRRAGAARPTLASDHTLRGDARRIAPLAWPVFVGQLAVLAFATVDTMLVGRHSSTDLAALAVGAATYVTVFIGLMGVVLAIGPIVGQLYGAKRLAEAGASAAPGACGWRSRCRCWAARCWPSRRLSWRWRRRRRTWPTRCAATCWRWRSSLPASLLFTVYRGFNIAVSRPKAVMMLQLGGLALKVPLSAALISGVPTLGVPALGRRRLRPGDRDRHVGAGAGRAAGAAARPLLRPLRAARPRPGAPAPRRRCTRCCAWACRWALTILIEVTGFAFMAIFIARLGATPVAGHQIAANLVSLMFMMPLALANATSHAGGAEHRRRSPARRAAPRLARPASDDGDGRHGGQRGVPDARGHRRPVHARCGSGGGRAVAAGLGGAVPLRRRDCRRSRSSCCAPGASPRCRW